MRILTVSDKVEPVLYGPYIRERVGQVDLVLACGDLPYYYLEYIVGLLDVPLYYVHGNHDKVIAPRADALPLAHAVTPLSWGVNLHGKTANHRGLLLAGLEGCRQYNPDAPFQYTEAEARWQVTVLSARLLANRMRHGRSLDVLITHAPPRGIHDDTDLPHQGFEAYLTLLERFRPVVMVHGHQHVYNRNTAVETQHLDTCVINTYGYRVLELEPWADGQGWALVNSNE